MITPVPGRTGPTPGAASTNPLFATLAAVLAASAALLTAAAASEQSDLLGWLAALAASGSLATWAASGAGRNPARRVRRDGPIVTVELRRAFPAAAAIFALTLAAFFAWQALDAGDDPLQRLLTGGCALMFLLPVPDLVRAALTGGRVVIGPERIEVTSWSRRAGVDWTDVTGVEADVTIPARPAVAIETRPDAPSLTSSRRRILLPLEPSAPHGQIVINALALDQPWMLAGRLDSLVGHPRADRARLLETNTVDLLTGQYPHP